MVRILRICGKCRKEILADDPEGLCVACVLETSLGMLQEESDGELTTEMPAELGGYELVEEIGHGGQGLVYRARQKGLNRLVALKVIGLGRWATKAHITRFRLEAEAAASLDHPHIVPIYEIGESDGSCYFSMKLVEGGRLDEVVKQGSTPVRRAVELTAKLARTVHYANERGILHRDIKPGNILLDGDGEPHLTDFGLARLVETESDITITTDALGTPSYMAPEQAGGQTAPLTTATDVYGLGAVLYHLLTGHPPFAGRTTYETIRLVLESEPRNPSHWNPKLDRDLATICLKCLEKDPQHRYPSARALAEDLERWLRHEPVRARPSGVLTRGKKWMRRHPTALLGAVSLLVVTTAVSLMYWKGEFVRPMPKGIAVLPFENLSNDREDASFADDVQDDLLIKLAKIADLKVISRTSVMEYRGKRNVRQIGEALRVSHVLEGSVRKTGTLLHVNAQLIDTRTDTHIWAEQYDRDLKDVFAIQSDIAQKVAQQLGAKISPAEKLAIERPQTADLIAFNLSTQAKNLLFMTSVASNLRANLLQAADLLDRAVAHDPSFFQAYCLLAHTHDVLYFLGFDHSAARLALAESAIEAAFRLRPDSGEAHLARAENLYRGYLDYDSALAELELARQSLPNDAMVFELRGYIERRQGKQEQALQSLERAVDLDPRNIFMLRQIAGSYDLLQRFADSATMLERALAIKPDDVETKTARAALELYWKADTRPLHRLIDSAAVTNGGATPDIAVNWLICALAERDAAAAKNALIALGEAPLSYGSVVFNHPFVKGVIARMSKDDDEAQSAFAAARAEQEKIVQAEPNYAPPLCVLGLIDAALGRKEEALREGRRAVELLPVEKDAVEGEAMIAYRAMIAAWVGDKDLACEQLAAAIRPPARFSYGDLKLLPFWDPLRGDPRFEKIVASLAPSDPNH